jgi:hypothetical protein
VRKEWIALVALLLLLPATSSAQYRSGAPEPFFPLPQNLLNLSFDKSYDTYHWGGIGKYNDSYGPLSIFLDDQLFSTLIVSGTNLTRTEESFGVSVVDKWLDNLSAVAQESTYVLSDNQTLGINTASTHAVYGGVDYVPVGAVNLEPLLGYRFDNQIGQYDKGFSTNLSALGSSADFGGYRTRLALNFHYDDLNPRAVELQNDTLKLDKIFFEDTRTAFTASYYQNKRDFYFAADTAIIERYGAANNIETRSDDGVTVGDSLVYGLGKASALTVQANVLSREIDRSVKYKDYTLPTDEFLTTDISELTIDGSGALTFPLLDVFSITGTGGYSDRTENHNVERDDSVSSDGYEQAVETEEFKNNHSRFAYLNGSVGVHISRTDSAVYSASTSILRYDTPSLDNTDDRDELHDVMNFSYMRRFNRYLFAQVNAEADLTHLVYLSGLRSADNNWNRVIRLGPRIAWTPDDRSYSNNTFEVLANYTTYDFESPGGEIQSFAFRQFLFIDSSFWALTRRFGIEWSNNIRLYERGQFDWNAFSEQPLAYFEAKTLIGSFRYTPQERLLFSVGIRYFSQEQFGYENSARVLQSFLHGLGPIAAIDIQLSPRSRVNLSGWFERQSQTGLVDQNLTTLSMGCMIFL